MSTKTIEQIERIDKRRYRLNLWRTIAFVLFVGGVLARTVVSEGTPLWSNFIEFFYSMGCGLTLVINIAFLRLTGRIRRDAELNEALNNEMFNHYTLRSAWWGYQAGMGAAFALLIATWFFEVAVPGMVCCLSILFVGTLGQSVALLVYDRTR